uniref:Reticulon n=1 Tax=Chelydra serpentina TaxID=8475 RepID=A0A8C3T585_CHESE
PPPAGPANTLPLQCLLHFSIVSVGSYGALAMLGITITLRLGRKALQALRRSDGANPFQAQLDAELPLSQEQLERLTARFSRDFLAAAHTLRRLFLVEDLVDSIKFAFLFYILTYVGAVFNGLTLLILGKGGQGRRGVGEGACAGQDQRLGSSGVIARAHAGGSAPAPGQERERDDAP